MPVRKMVATASYISRRSRTSRSRTGPGWSSNSVAAATYGQPPGRASQVSQCSNRARTRASPRGVRSAGRTTAVSKSSRARSNTWSCSPSLDLKWANSPLLDSCACSASMPMVSPPRPTRRANWTASSSTACLVSSPLPIRQEKHDRSDTSRMAAPSSGLRSARSRPAQGRHRHPRLRGRLRHRRARSPAVAGTSGGGGIERACQRPARMRGVGGWSGIPAGRPGSWGCAGPDVDASRPAAARLGRCNRGPGPT